jgi:hypothetical protein
MKKLVFELIFMLSLLYNGLQACTNPFSSRVVKATGDWTVPTWNPSEPTSLMTFDSVACQYTLSVGGLRPNYYYSWKVIS